ncbi:MAG: histidine phosphatase family protein [Acidimicrobiia bacterium]|nr:histidine phosphatase family protein [Acidimicrobiia bacterium]
MKRLLLMRHAKSDWDASYDADRQRPLNRRGIASAKTMGQALSTAGEIPDRILSSPAVRARTTAELAARAGGWDVDIQIRDELYGASPGEVLKTINAAGGNSERLLVVGHEPTTSQTVTLLCGARVRVATATVIGLDLAPDDWKRLEPDSTTLAYLLGPRLFPKMARPIA